MTNHDTTTDLAGRPLTEDEKELIDLYERLKALSARDDVAPCVQANAAQAMVMLWNACCDLGLVYEEPGVD